MEGSRWEIILSLERGAIGIDWDLYRHSKYPVEIHRRWYGRRNVVTRANQLYGVIFRVATPLKARLTWL